MKYGDFSMKKADTLFMSVVKHPVVTSDTVLWALTYYIHCYTYNLRNIMQVAIYTIMDYF